MNTFKLADYTIAWICALVLEAAAARAMLDKIHAPPQQISDTNAYEFGELNGHCIVIAYLPNGVYGTVSAATVVSRICLTFPRLQLGLMAGIGGGVPSKSNDIRLGDVVASKPGRKHGGVIHYDYGKAVQGGRFEPTGILNQPPQSLLTHMSQLQAKQMTEGEDGISKIVSDVLKRNPDMNTRFSSPTRTTDYLFEPSYHHADNDSDCEKSTFLETIYVHYGLIASGDQVMKDSVTRDRLARKHGVLCFEMEAAGLMNELPTLVIRGICDYCDSHKQKQWQGYAALTAAAYGKLLLAVMPPCKLNSELLESSKIRHGMVSLPRNPKFVGRGDEIKKLEELLSMQDGPRRIAITGLGGVGKTQVALELAYRRRDQDSGCSVFWVPCTSYEMIEQSFHEIAQILGLCDVKPAEVKEQMQAYLSSKNAGKWLLVFDNADDTDFDFLPQSEQGRILFTTRNWELAVELTYSNIVPIPAVDKEIARNILESLLLQKSLLKHDGIIVALLKYLEYLPLAIAQAAAYINKKRLDLAAYLTLLQDEEQHAVELLSEKFRNPGRYRDIENAVITTWLISFKQIQHQDPLAADYLSFITCISPRNIPQSLLPAQISGKKKRVDALGLLNAYNFINSQEGDINMHRLKNRVFSHWVQRVADQMEKVFPNDHYTNRGLWRQYLPHALALVHESDFTNQQDPHINLVENIANCLLSDGRYLEAEVLYVKLLEFQKRNGPEDPSTLRSMANLASTYWSQGRLNEAEKLEVQVMETSKTVLGAEHPDTLTSMANLASTYRNQGRWNEAGKLEVQVMESSKTVLGAEHPDTLSSMSNIASTLWNQGRFHEAEKLFIHVMETRKIVLGVEHPATLTSMANLASTYQNQGRWNEAEKLEIQVMETSEIILGAEHPSTLSSMANLTSTYRSQGRWNEAEKLEVQVIKAFKTVLGSKHPNTLRSIAHLASTYQKQGRWNEAEKLFMHVTETRKIMLGVEHPDTLSSMANLASTYRNQGRWDKAEKLSMQVMGTRKRVLGPEHPDTLTSMANLAYTWKARGKLQDSLALMRRCSEVCNKVIGPNHPLTRSSSRAVSDWKDEHKQVDFESRKKRVSGSLLSRSIVV
ncbi:hypothetical protein BDV09DRAFT_182992 [Aspergillus tetrazonus]